MGEVTNRLKPFAVPNLENLTYGYRAKNRIYLADCMEVMEAMEPKSVQLIIADPPYYRVKGDFDFVWDSFDDYLKDVERWAVACKRVLAENGTIYWWGMDRKIAYSQMILDRYFHLLSTCVWEKPSIASEWETRRTFPERGQERFLVYGNHTPKEDLEFLYSNYAHFLGIKEYLRNEKREFEKRNGDIYLKFRKTRFFHYWAEGLSWSFPSEDAYSMLNETGFFSTPYPAIRQEFEKEASEILSHRRPFFNTKKLSDIWRFPQEKNEWNHDTKKPESIARAIIETSSRPGDTVFVPFAGSGTECAVSVKLGRNFIASEIDPKHHATATNRVLKAKAGIQPRTAEEVKQAGGQIALFDQV